MKNLLLLLVFAVGALGGYLLGDHKGKADREALAKVVATEKEVSQANKAIIAKRDADLEKISSQYQQDIAANKKEYEAKQAEWQRTKGSLETTIRSLTGRAAELNRNLDELKGQLPAANSAEKMRLEGEIAKLKVELETTQRELEGKKCLATAVPPSVINVLGGAK